VSEARSYRNVRDLLDIIFELERRIRTLESAPRLGSTSLDGGELTIRGGDIVVRDDNNKEVARMMHGAIPMMRFRPANTALEEYQLVTFGWEAEDTGAAYQASVQDINGNQDGGKLLLMRDAVYLSKQPADPSRNEAMITIGALMDEDIRFQGHWGDGGQLSKLDALDLIRVDVVAGFSAYVHTYTYPYDTTPAVFYTILNTAGTVNHVLTACDNTGFTLTWGGTGAKVIFIMVMRRPS
jgi:hypothetical protein